MPYTVEVDAARGLVRVVVRGEVDAALAKPMVTDARAAAHAGGHNILYDFRAATQGKITPADVFWFPRSIPALATPEATRPRIAVIHDGSLTAMMGFWETTFRNVGLQARAFDDEAAAYRWLQGKDPA